jgi:outer membrane protein TolC
MKKTVLGLLLFWPALCRADEPAPNDGPLQLSLKRAVAIALAPEGNTRIQLTSELIHQAKARSQQARAALLPDLEASAGRKTETENLNSLGLSTIKLPFSIRIPRDAGPFDVMDARATVVQNLFDYSAIRRLQASHSAVSAARADREDAFDAVSALVAKVYMSALRADAELEASNANVTMSEAVLKQSENQKAAGNGTGIEITRARVELLNQKQRLLSARNERTKARLDLLRAMNISLDTEIALTDALGYTPMDAVTFEQAKKDAGESRADLKAQLSRENSLRLSASATKMERLPSIAAFADYGSTGSGFENAIPTYEYGYVVKVPVFDGWRRDARRAESNSAYRQEQIRTRDLKQQIELEIKRSLDSLHIAADQISVATEALTLAESELEQARRRYDAGVANGLEVTDAQTRLARARDNRIAALFSFNLARLDYGEATGTIRRMLD